MNTQVTIDQVTVSSNNGVCEMVNNESAGNQDPLNLGSKSMENQNYIFLEIPCY